MPTPYDYTVAQPNVGSYFDAMRQGRADRLTAENDQKMNALSRYLPGALQGDKSAQDMALQSAPVDKMAGLVQTFREMDASKLAAVKDFRAQTAAGAYAIKDPAQWAAFQERQRAEAQRLGIPFADVPFEQKDAVIAMGRTVEQLINEEMERKKLALEESRTNAQNAASYASADAARASAEAARRKPVAGIDPYTGARLAPPGVQGRDSNDLQGMRKTAEAASNIAATLRSSMDAFKQAPTGPGFGAQRNVAGVLSIIPGYTWAERQLGSTQTNDIVNAYDAIENASTKLGIDELQKMGGSDTNMELLTAIKTAPNASATPAENSRRISNLLAASEILSQKADLATQWVNKAGALSYTIPDEQGRPMTWPMFWNKFQKAAWDDHMNRERNPGPSGGARNYRQEQRDLQNAKPAQVVPPPPPGFEVR